MKIYITDKAQDYEATCPHCGRAIEFQADCDGLEAIDPCDHFEVVSTDMDWRYYPTGRPYAEFESDDVPAARALHGGAE